MKVHRIEIHESRHRITHGPSDGTTHVLECMERKVTLHGTRMPTEMKPAKHPETYPEHRLKALLAAVIQHPHEDLHDVTHHHP